MIGLAALGGLMGGAGVLTAAFAIFLSGPPILTRGARFLAVAGLLVGAAGLAQELMANGFQLDLSQQRGGMGQGSLFAAGGMLLLTFGAVRVAERRRAGRDRERWLAEHRSGERPTRR